MSKGYFFDADGVPVYFGTRADKPALEGRAIWVDESAAGPRPSDLHVWNGSAWTESPDLVEAERKRGIKDDLRRMDLDAPRLVEDLIAALVAKGLIAEADLAPEATAKIEAKRAARAALEEE